MTTLTLRAARVETLLNGGGTYRKRPDGDLERVTADGETWVVGVPGGRTFDGPDKLSLAWVFDEEESWETFGTWVDGETNVVYVDPVVLISNKVDAVAIGRALGEKAIYGLHNGEEVRL